MDNPWIKTTQLKQYFHLTTISLKRKKSYIQKSSKKKMTMFSKKYMEKIRKKKHKIGAWTKRTCHFRWQPCKKKNINGIQIYKYIYIYTYHLFLFLYEREKYISIYICIYLDIHWLQISDQGRFWFDFCPVSLNLSISFHVKKTWPFQEKTYRFMFSFLSHVESARAFPPFSRVFPPFFREFPPRKIDIFLRKEE